MQLSSSRTSDLGFSNFRLTWSQPSAYVFGASLRLLLCRCRWGVTCTRSHRRQEFRQPERTAAHMPHVTIKTGIAGPDGREEELTEYLCDWPGCSNVAEHVLGYVRELGLGVAVCQQHVTSRDSGH